MRKVQTFTRVLPNEAATPTIQSREAIVYFHAEWKEYCVRFYLNGVHQRLADYFTDDKEDAISSADYFVNREL